MGEPKGGRRRRFTMGAMMVLVAMIALGTAMLRARSSWVLTTAMSATGLALLMGLVATRGAGARWGLFLMGASVFGGGYFVAMTPWDWKMEDQTGYPRVGVPDLLPTSAAFEWLADSWIGTGEPSLEFDSRNRQVIETYRANHFVTLGMLHVECCWAFAAVGGCFGCGLATYRDRQGAARADRP